MVGPMDIYVKMGSEVLLTCIVSQGPHELGSIFWYRGKQVVQFFIAIFFSLNELKDERTTMNYFSIKFIFHLSFNANLDSASLDVSSQYQSNDIDYSPRITIETKWTDALRSR